MRATTTWQLFSAALLAASATCAAPALADAADDCAVVNDYFGQAVGYQRALGAGGVPNLDDPDSVNNFYTDAIDTANQELRDARAALAQLKDPAVRQKFSAYVNVLSQYPGLFAQRKAAKSEAQLESVNQRGEDLQGRLSDAEGDVHGSC
ncbi:hypothetical protein Srot_2159 [Segniliparus rotundus DSM 44985]|uniref:Secreted protein n=1 Tax=Segniliparus rotundus (strain ATCC BAA-972 / CDC 1076 / CIP 108378 / DSM 44985 / JCM 13578) TaxID=640132 RepID=D6Z9U1_SEGRD|nr:hypothetical protein [Segniliparus rotundus]ADG98611.1 hypothetical protein Srot_2159 [Segniliparus rotundus DSM 44985]